MSALPFSKETEVRNGYREKESIQRVRKEITRKQVVTFILFVIFLYQIASLPGAIMMDNALSIGTVILGIVLCGLAMLFNQMGKIGLVSFLLILVVDLGCGLMLLTPGMAMSPSMSSSQNMSTTGTMAPAQTGMSPTSTSKDMGKMKPTKNGMSTPTSKDMGTMTPATGSMPSSKSTGGMSSTEDMSTARLDVSELPTFDLLVISELIAASLLSAGSIFPVAITNILFILGMVAFMPRTSELDMLLHSSMAYNALAQPICLQLVVAAITYLWVRSALRAAVRADRAEEIATLQHSQALMQEREIEQKRLIEMGVNELLQGLTQGINGQEISIHLKQDHALWKIGNAVNLLLTRLRRMRQIDQENQHLRFQIIQMRERLLEAQMVGSQDSSSAMRQKRGNSQPGF